MNFRRKFSGRKESNFGENWTKQQGTILLIVEKSMWKSLKKSIFHTKVNVLSLKNGPIFGKNWGRQASIFRKNWCFLKIQIKSWKCKCLFTMQPGYPVVCNSADATDESDEEATMIGLDIYLFIYLSIYLSISLSLHLSIFLSIHLLIYRCIYLIFIYPSA